MRSFNFQVLVKRVGLLSSFAALAMLISACDPTGRFSPFGSVPPTPTPVVVCTSNSGASSPTTNVSYPPLNSVSMVSPTEGWAAGYYNDATLVHYHDGKWIPLSGSAAIDDYIQDVHMLSADDGLAGGYAGIIRYHDGCWQIERAVPGIYNKGVNAVYLLSSAEAWAAGDRIFHYHSNHWDELSDGDKAVGGSWVNSISMLSSSEGWAVGEAGLILHYRSGQWMRVDSPIKGELDAVQMVSTNEGWAVGWESVAGYGGNSSILHYKAGKWTVQQRLESSALSGVSMLSANEGWAVGGSSRGIQLPGVVMLLHYKDGNWKDESINIPGELRSVQMLSTNEGWAVGVAQDRKSGLILHYQHGTWSEYKLASP